jgi:eukaryotic-like serine/threonine-protein kinase
MTDQGERIGQLIGGYRLQRHLGKGSFGTVYLAEHVQNHSQAAVKLLRIRLTGRDDFRNFLNEARMIRLHHPHIVSILDFGMGQDDFPFLVMEYAAGGTLRDRHPKGTKLPPETIMSYVEQLASALQHAHDHHLIHQDVKPENMLVRPDGTVLLSDFGIAKIIEQSTLHSLQSTAGTPAYMAPEQSQGKPCPDSDQYALAVIIYEWFSGIRPFQGGPLEVIVQHRIDPPPSLCALCPELSPQVEQVLFKALNKAPTERFPSVAHFSEALQVAMQGTSALTLTAPNLAVLPTVPLPPLIVPSGEPATPRTTPSEVGISPPPVPESSIERQATAVDTSEKKLLSSAPDRLLETPPPKHSQVVAPRSGHRRRVLVALLCLILLITTGGGGTWLFLQTYGATSAASLATATANARRTATNVANAHATATAAANEYEKAATAQGVQFGFDAGHTNWNPYERVINSKNVTQLATRWSYSTGGSIDTSPIVVNGVVYIDSSDGKLYAFDATCHNTCQPLWSFKIGDANAPSSYAYPFASSLAEANGVVYTSSSVYSSDGTGTGKLYAFDGTCRSTCQPLWLYTLTGSTVSSPTVADGVIYISSTPYPVSGPPGDSNLYAFDATCRSACQPLWSYTLTGPTYSSSPTVANGLVYIDSTPYSADGSPSDSKLYAFDTTCRSACKPIQSYSVDGMITSLPAAANGVVYVSTTTISNTGPGDGKFSALDATCHTACKPLWSYVGTGSVFSTPAVTNNVVFVNSTTGFYGSTANSKLYAFDVTCHSACQPLWSYVIARTVYSSPTVANNVVYVSATTDTGNNPGDTKSKLYAFDASCHSPTCQPLWSNDSVTGIVRSSPFVANGVVYIGAYVGPSDGSENQGKLYALGLPS